MLPTLEHLVIKNKQIYEKNYQWGSPPKGVLRKIMLMTKLTIFLILISVFCATATVYSQSTRLSLNLEQATISEVLQVIESQTEYRFIYESNKLDLDKKINLNVTEQQVEKILDKIFEKNEINYSITENNLILIKPIEDSVRNVLAGQQKDVKGKIVDETGEPLPGVTVVVKGTTQGTVSNVDGEYSITNVPDDATLQFSFVGMQTQEVPVANKTKIDLTMLPDAIGIEEVVAIGYGTQKKADLTGAVASVRIADMQKITTAQTSIALQGKVAGVNVVQSDAGPGNSADIRIRGIGTLNNHYPLVIVDGVPSSMTSVDPKDIASIDVLKDAASAAIYGSRAANGVIIITTKRGDGGTADKTNISYRAYASFESREKDFGMINNAADYIGLVKTASDNMGQEYPGFVQAWESNPADFGNTNWEDALFGDAFSHKHELSVSRKGKDFNFYISSIFSDQEGIRIGSANKRATFRVNSDFTLGRLKIGESFSIGRSRGDYNPLTSNSYSFFDNVQRTPLHKVYDDNTDSGLGGSLFEYGFKALAHPFIPYEVDDRKYDNYSILGSAYAELEIIKNLKYKLQVSQNVNLGSTFIFEPSFYTNTEEKRGKFIE